MSRNRIIFLFCFGIKNVFSFFFRFFTFKNINLKKNEHFLESNIIMIKNFVLNTQFQPCKYPSLYSIRDSKDLVLRLGLDSKLEVHNGCVS